MAVIQGRLLFKGGFYSRAASIQGRVLFKGGFYSRAASIQGRLLFKGGFYSRAASIQGRLLFKGGFYSRAASIQGRLLFKGGFYSRAASIQGSLSFMLFVKKCGAYVTCRELGNMCVCGQGQCRAGGGGGVEWGKVSPDPFSSGARKTPSHALFSFAKYCFFL